MTKLKVKSSILGIELYKPGKSSVEGVSKIIKLSSNENAFGTSKKVEEFLKQYDFSNLHRYPDGNSTILRDAIAEKYNLKADNLICGAGSDEIISMIAWGFLSEGDEAIYTRHGFLMYPIAIKTMGAIPVIAEENDLRASVENILAKVTDKTRVVFIANPNNPTGSYLTKDEMSNLREKLPQNILLVVDSAYAEFARDIKDYDDGISLAHKYDNVITTRTFSKIYGLASLRIGWAYANQDIIDILNRVRGPFNLTTLSQHTGKISLSDQEFLDRSIEHNKKWIKILTDEINNIGFVAYPSIANFVTVKFLDNNKNSDNANKFLMQNGIIVRDISSYDLKNFLRITIGTDEENLLLIDKIREFSML